MKAWHFTNGKLRDGSPVPAIGEKLRFNGEIKIHRSGLHASARLIDALKYAPGHILHRVNLSGDLILQNDKMVGRERTIIWSIDAHSLLRDFARLCALDVVHFWDAPDFVIKYLKTGDERLRESAYISAADAARVATAAYTTADAAAYAAYAAAYAAYAAACATDDDAVRAAAYAARAARHAADAAAYAANVMDGKLNRRLTAMAVAAHKREA